MADLNLSFSPSRAASRPANPPAAPAPAGTSSASNSTPPAGGDTLVRLSGEGERYLQRRLGELRASAPPVLMLPQLLLDAWQIWIDWTEALLGLPADSGDDVDKRFAHHAWRADPRFHGLLRSYRAYSRFMLHGLAQAPVDEATRRRLGFLLRQAIDAMSPANFLATNPEALQLAIDTQGMSLAKGIELFMRDAARGRITQSDEAAFEIGRNVAATPGAVVYENELMQLIHYRPLTRRVARQPLLMVPPCINKFYILDLQPSNSLVRFALEEGQNVFMVSWRNIGPAQAHFTWDDYVQMGVLQALNVARDVAEADSVHALGFCIGGALLSSALALMAARGQTPAASLTLLATMLDYADTGEIGLMVSERTVRARERSIGRGGLMQGAELAMTFSALRANDLIWPYVVDGYLKGRPPRAFDMLFWNADTANLPGPMFAWYLRHTYLENRLRLPGGTVQCGEPVDLSRITVPTYLYASKDDHLVPWRTCYESTRILGGPMRFVLGASGHIAGVINPPAHGKRHFWTAAQLAATADGWLDSARQSPGSWWTDWMAWLKAQGGQTVAASRALGNRLYPEIEPAPGRYVRERHP